VGVPPADDYELGRYLNAIREADTQIGRLMDALRDRKLADDTLIVITGDHGEGFGAPHDVYGHGSRVYEELLHVPMVLWNPKLFAGGRTSDAVGGLIDLGATICDAVGVPPAGSWQGTSLLDPNRAPRTFFSAANDGYLLGVRQEQWKYVFNATRGREELFDLGADPTEQKNVAREHPELSRELRQRLGAWLASQRQRYPVLQH
jgi:arylsulfatase A-like enzyme